MESIETDTAQYGVLQPLLGLDVVLDTVFSCFLPRDLLAMRLVCKRTQFVTDNCNHDGIPSLWRGLLDTMCSNKTLIDYWIARQDRDDIVGIKNPDKRLRFMRYVMRCLYGFGFSRASIAWLDNTHTYWKLLKDEETMFPHNAQGVPYMRFVCWFHAQWRMTIAEPGQYDVMCRVFIGRNTDLENGLDWRFDVQGGDDGGNGSRMRWGTRADITQAPRGWIWVKVGSVTTRRPFAKVKCQVINHSSWWKSDFGMDGVVFRRIEHQTPHPSVEADG